ncbi:hypothetical protein [Capillimicrobium parvum]|uniref:hypothetical protein n=1 Tax=Capillimicrobium parvum TaxID=2884022 RepID=UPI00216AF570|nr:hypothetical protein [Capillimicrobium parvum]
MPRRRRRLPGAIEPPWARRRRLRAERPTQVLGVLALVLTAAVAADEALRVVAGRRSTSRRARRRARRRRWRCGATAPRRRSSGGC